jgi:hypothetical protein
MHRKLGSSVLTFRDKVSVPSYNYKCKVKVTGKVHPINCQEGTRGGGGLRYNSATLSLTCALVGAGWSRPHPGRRTTGKVTWYPLYEGLGGQGHTPATLLQGK